MANVKEELSTETNKSLKTAVQSLQAALSDVEEKHEEALANVCLCVFLMFDFHCSWLDVTMCAQLNRQQLAWHKELSEKAAQTINGATDIMKSNEEKNRKHFEKVSLG